MISGKAKLAGVMGWPIAHSLSPALHGHWIETLSVDAAYVPLAVREVDFQSVVAALPLMGFRGINVTLPHKETALRLADTADDAARACGAANTLVFDQGRVHAMNTDVTGFLASLDEAGVGDLEGKSVTVLGAGGAARAVVHGLLRRCVAEIRLCNRTLAKGQGLAHFFGEKVKPLVWEEAPAALASSQLLVNTTKLGMAGEDPLGVDLSTMPAGGVVVDIVYRPLETGLLARARARGLMAVDGLGMLLHQAVPGFRAWFDTEPRVTPALRAHLVGLLEGR